MIVSRRLSNECMSKSTRVLFGGNVLGKPSGGKSVVSQDFAMGEMEESPLQSKAKTHDDVFDTSKFEPIPPLEDEYSCNSASNDFVEPSVGDFYVGNISMEADPVMEEIAVSVGNFATFGDYSNREKLRSVWMPGAVTGDTRLKKRQSESSGVGQHHEPKLRRFQTSRPSQAQQGARGFPRR